MIETIIAQQLDSIVDPKDRDTIGSILHEFFEAAVIQSALNVERPPEVRAAQQEMLALGLQAVKQYAQKKRTPAAKPVRAFTAAPTTDSK